MDKNQEQKLRKLVQEEFELIDTAIASQNQERLRKVLCFYLELDKDDIKLKLIKHILQGIYVQYHLEQNEHGKGLVEYDPNVLVVGYVEGYKPMTYKELLEKILEDEEIICEYFGDEYQEKVIELLRSLDTSYYSNLEELDSIDNSKETLLKNGKRIRHCLTLTEDLFSFATWKEENYIDKATFDKVAEVIEKDLEKLLPMLLRSAYFQVAEKKYQEISIEVTHWTDSLGNTYHSGNLWVDSKKIHIPFTLGCDDCYLRTVYDLLVKYGYKEKTSDRPNGTNIGYSDWLDECRQRENVHHRSYVVKRKKDMISDKSE